MQSLALCLAVSACFTAVMGMSPGYGHDYDYHTLAELEEAVHRVASEKMLVVQRMNMLAMQKADLDQALKDVLAQDVIPVNDLNQLQAQRLIAIIDRLKAFYHSIGELEARLAAQAAISSGAQNWLWTLQQEVDVFVHKSNINQNAALKEIETILSRTETKLDQKLTDHTAKRSDSIEKLEVEIDTFKTKVSTRKCFVGVVEVTLDPIGQGSAELPFQPVGFFVGNTPTVLCGTQGIVVKLQPDQSRSYYTYGDEKKDHMAVTVDCKPSTDKVVVNVVDQSSGGQDYGKNQVMVVYVEARACSFAALEGF